MIEQVLAFALDASSTVTLADSSSDGDGVLFLLALGPLSAVAFYGAMMRRYRNHDKRYEYEHRSDSRVYDLQSYDNKTGKVRGTSRRRINGDNSNNPRERLGSRTSVFRSW